MASSHPSIRPLVQRLLAAVLVVVSLSGLWATGSALRNGHTSLPARYGGGIVMKEEKSTLFWATISVSSIVSLGVAGIAGWLVTNASATRANRK